MLYDRYMNIWDMSTRDVNGICLYNLLWALYFAKGPDYRAKMFYNTINLLDLYDITL